MIGPFTKHSVSCRSNQGEDGPELPQHLTSPCMTKLAGGDKVFISDSKNGAIRFLYDFEIHKWTNASIEEKTVFRPSKKNCASLKGNLVIYVMIRSEGEIKTQILNVTSMSWISEEFLTINGKFISGVIFPSDNGKFVTFMGTPKGDNKDTLIYQVQ